VLSEKVNPAWSEKQQEMWVAQKCALLALGGDGGLILKLQEAVRTGLDVSNIGRRAQAMCARFALEGGTAVEDAVGVIESSIEAVKLGQMVGHRKEKGAMRL
jgi:hypothetical protein